MSTKKDEFLRRLDLFLDRPSTTAEDENILKAFLEESPIRHKTLLYIDDMEERLPLAKRLKSLCEVIKRRPIEAFWAAIMVMPLSRLREEVVLAEIRENDDGSAHVWLGRQVDEQIKDMPLIFKLCMNMLLFSLFSFIFSAFLVFFLIFLFFSFLTFPFLFQRFFSLSLFLLFSYVSATPTLRPLLMSYSFCQAQIGRAVRRPV